MSQQNGEKLYTRTDLEEAMKNVLAARDEQVLERLKDEGLLKEDSEPGSLKKFLAGMGRKVTKHIDAVIADGEEVLVKNAMTSAKDKAEKREREAFEKTMKEKYSK